jgi:hypothetical protein
MQGIEYAELSDELPDDTQSKEDAAAEQAAMIERLQIFGQGLQGRADKQVQLRRSLEDRWIQDLRQYNGQYEPDIMAGIKATGGSEAFVNVTRGKVATAEARLADMLLPTDDENWSIEPTPIPDLQDGVKSTQVLGQIQGQPVREADIAKIAQQSAKDKSDKMQRLMQDQLAECNYTAIQREILHDAALYGTGILKGPMILGRTRTQWKTVADEATGETMYMAVQAEDNSPTALRVDVWNFFPDMSASRIEDAEYVFERHFLTRKQVRDLAKQPGFLSDQINEILLETDEPKVTAWHLAEMRQIAGQDNNTQDNRFELWEYHGPIDKKDLAACGCEVDENDALNEVMGVVWFCNNRVIKASINPLDSEALPYSVYAFETDGTSLFGYGMPWLCRHSQRVVNGAFRMMMDNAGLSAGPQVVVNPAIIRPQDGDSRLRPRKVWLMSDATKNPQQAFATFNIDPHMNEMMGLFNTGMRLVDEETQIPMIAQGDQASHITKTAQGMSILMNSANTVLRRAVKLYDDRVTRPFISRLYEWNMQFHDDDAVKGDYQIVARGSSALMEKEGQSKALMSVMQLAGTPMFAPLTDFPSLYKKMLQSLRIEADGVMKSPEDLKAMQQPQGPQQPPVDQAKQAELQLKAQQMQADMQLNQARMQLQAQALQLKGDEQQQSHAVAVARMQLEQALAQQAGELELQKLAAQENMTMQQLQAELGIQKLNIDSKHQLFNAEAAIKAAQGSGI